MSTRAKPAVSIAPPAHFPEARIKELESKLGELESIKARLISVEADVRTIRDRGA